MAFDLYFKVLFLLTLKAAGFEALEVTEHNACDVCSCGPGPSLHPKELVKCTDFEALIEFSSLPAFVRGVHIENGQKGVSFKRGSIKVKKSYKISVNKASYVDFAEKSTTLWTGANMTIDIDHVGHLSMKSRSVSSTSGNFVLKVDNTVQVDIEGQAFDVMTSVSLSSIGQLNLAPAAFRPNAPLSLQKPQTKIEFSNIGMIPGLPMEAFSSAQSISFVNCKITDIESTAFSGMSVHNVTFESSIIERIHSSAFPDQNFVEHLSFLNCTLISISEKADLRHIRTETFTYQFFIHKP